MSLPFNLNSVLATASLIEGFDVVRNAFPVEGRFTKKVIDMTYVRKHFVDTMISLANLNGYYMTDFKPYLKVVEYNEIEKEEYDLRREQGL